MFFLKIADAEDAVCAQQVPALQEEEVNIIFLIHKHLKLHYTQSESTIGFGKGSTATTEDIPVQEVSDVSYIVSSICCTIYTQITAVKKNTGSDVTDISHLVRRKVSVSLIIIIL